VKDSGFETRGWGLGTASPLRHGDTEACKQRLFFSAPLCLSGDRSRIATVVCVPLTSNLKWALAPGNVHLSARLTGLPRPSVANTSLIVSVDKDLLTERVGKLPPSKLGLVLAGIETVLGKWP
jgi:mRNA interferase MazF